MHDSLLLRISCLHTRQTDLIWALSYSIWYNFPQLTTNMYMQILKIVNYGMLVWFNPKFSKT